MADFALVLQTTQLGAAFVGPGGANQAIALNIASAPVTLLVQQNVIAVLTVSSQGPAGFGIPSGGTVGQLITKTGSDDFAFTWANPFAPTGTGFRHINAGTEDAASKFVTDADVASAAAIAESKIANLVPDLAAKLAVTAHPGTRDLIHFLGEGPGDGFGTNAYKKILPASSAFPTSIIWYADAGLTQKIVEKLLTWSGAVPSQIQYKIYAADGATVLHTVTDSISYTNSIFESTRTRAIA